MKLVLAMEVGLSPDDFMLDGNPAPRPRKGAPCPIFGLFLLWPNGWMDQVKMPLGMEVGLGRGHIVLCGDPAPPKKVAQQPPIFGLCLL